jgi:NitT/TauT family transport system ATP-binding protein
VSVAQIMSVANTQGQIVPQQPLLDVAGVTLRYKTPGAVITATERVDFQVNKSDRFVLLGPSGCGKSTLLKAVGGYLQPSKAASRSRAVKLRSPVRTA